MDFNKDMFIFKEEVDMDAWYNNPDPEFSDICLKSRVPANWRSYQIVLSGQFSNTVIKPINHYAEFMSDPPQLVSIEGNTVRLRQGTMAEIYLLEPTERDTVEKFSATDRPWVRQFYISNLDLECPEDCFNHLFKWYTPWFIDANISNVRFEQPVGVESPFSTFTVEGTYSKQPRDIDYVAPYFVPFYFKKYGDHMEDPGEFTIVKGNSPMYDIVFDADDIIIKEIKEFYERYQVLSV